MKIIKGVVNGAKKVVIYGPEGIGKSTLASKFPDPLFIDTEGSTKYMDVARTEPPASWGDLLTQIKMISSEKPCKTLVIDTADWAELKAIEHVCESKRVKGIEDIGYGKGYTYVGEEFQNMLKLLDNVIEAGINVVVTAHAKMRKFEQPDELGAYDRWEMKLSKQSSPLLKEWADIVLFCNYKTSVINVDGQGATKGKNKVTGGKRVMYTSHHPCWDAKNRYGLPEELDMSYEEIKPIIEPSEKKSESVVQKVEPKKDIVHKSTDKIDIYDLMKLNGVSKEELEAVVAAKGYYPAETHLEEYDPGFVNDVLVGAWDNVLEAINESKNKGFIKYN